MPTDFLAIWHRCNFCGHPLLARPSDRNYWCNLGNLGCTRPSLRPCGLCGSWPFRWSGRRAYQDVMMQEGGVYMLNSPYAIPAAVFTAVLLFMFPEPLDRFPRMLEWTDIISVGLFAVVGTDKALVYHLLPFSVILMGSITGVGGGMLRDVFLGDIPRIFQRSNLYAFCAVAGATSYWALVSYAGGHQNLGSRCLRCCYRWPEALVAQVQRAFSGRR